MFYLAERPEEPVVLATLSADRIKTFLEDFEAYSAAGGRKPWTLFISPGLRSFVSYSVFEAPPSDDQFLAYLRELARQTPANIAAIKKR